MKNDNLYNLLCGVNSKEVEALIFWIGQFCGNKGLILNGEKYELMWYLFDEADQLFGGMKNKELPLYTTKELMKKYYDTVLAAGLTKCDVCRHDKTYTTGGDEYPAYTTIGYCAKGHWEGACEPEPTQEDFWKDCKDFEPCS